MQARQTLFPTAVALAAVALGFAAGAGSANVYPFRHAEPARVETRVVGHASTTDFDYFPGHYVNQATEIEELPAQF